MNKERVFNSQIVVSLPFAVKEESPPTSFISMCIYKYIYRGQLEYEIFKFI
jgi:hypothetical protein